MTAPAMKVKGLSVALPQRNGMTRILDEVDLELAPAEMAGLAGESGCGKSLLARALMGLLDGTGARVDAISLSLGGRAVTSPARGFTADRGRRIAMVFQEPATALDPAFTIGWQLRTVLRRRFGFDRNKAHQRAIEALFDAGLTEAERIYRAYPHQLSGGMQQRAMIAMAAALEPEVLIADEPTTALDVTTQRLVMDQFEKLRQSAGTAILLISHDIGLIAEYCSRISIMYCGQIVEAAAYADFYHRPRHPYSSALLQALPRLHDWHPPAPLMGAVTSPAEWPPGCRFAPRCPQASDRCREQAPAALTEEDRMFACHHPL